LTVLVVAVVVLAPFAVRWVRRANRKVNAALRDFQRPTQPPAQTNAPAPKETHTV
jgi:hypothetical protein